MLVIELNRISLGSERTFYFSYTNVYPLRCRICNYFSNWIQISFVYNFLYLNRWVCAFLETFDLIGIIFVFSWIFLLRYLLEYDYFFPNFHSFLLFKCLIRIQIKIHILGKKSFDIVFKKNPKSVPVSSIKTTLKISANFFLLFTK